MKSRDQVKAASRTLDVFEAFAAARSPLSLTELAQRIAVPVSSCHALVRTLQHRGYVYVLEERKRIYPTKRLAALAAGISRHDPVLEGVAPVLAGLASATGETVILGKSQGDHVVYLDVIEGKHTVRFNASPGDVRPSHSSAIGKSTLGLLGDEELREAIRRLTLKSVTAQTITDPARLEADIIASRIRGYFVSRGETVSDVMGISIAQKISGEPYAVGVAGPVSRLDENLETYVRHLKEAGSAIERIDLELRGAA